MSTAGGQAWLQMVAACDRVELLEAAFEAAGAEAVTVRGDGAETLIEPEPGTAPMWTRAEVAALFPAGTDPVPIADELEAVLDGRRLRWRAELIEDRDWVRAWMDAYRPMPFGRRLWVCPHHAEVDIRDAVVLRLDPGPAFGTGTHATTALCLEWLDARPPSGLEVLDYGCGSGVLALAAARLGATAVQAVDIDPRALAATAENARDNGVESRTRIDEPAAAAEADVVLANVLAGPLIRMAPTITALVRPGGRLVLSGILADQAEAVQAAYAPAVRFDGGAARDGWVRLDGTRIVATDVR